MFGDDSEEDFSFASLSDHDSSSSSEEQVEQEEQEEQEKQVFLDFLHFKKLKKSRKIKRSRKFARLKKRAIEDDDEYDHEFSPALKKTKNSFDTNPLNAIPDDVLFHSVLLFLPFKQVLRMRLVCKYFDRLVLSKWLANSDCKLIPKLRDESIPSDDCNFTNLIVGSFPYQGLSNFYGKFQNIMNLFCINLEDTYLMKAVPFTRLESLHLVRCSLNGADILTLFQSNHLRNLKKLCLDSNKLRGDGHLNQILNRNICPKLEILSVCSNNLSDECTYLFENENNSNLPINFHTLIIDCNSISPNGQLVLVNNEKLRILSIDGKRKHFFKIDRPLTLKYLKVKISHFHHDIEMSRNTTIFQNFAKLEDEQYLKFEAINEMVYSNNLDKYFDNNFTIESSLFGNLEQNFYIDKLLSLHDTSRTRRAMLYELRKDWDSAILKYKELNLLDKIAIIHYEKLNPPNYATALHYFDSCPANTQSKYYEEIGTCYFKTEIYELAKEYFEKNLTKLSPKSLQFLGISCYRLKNYVKAIEYLSRIENLTDSESIMALAYSILEVDTQRKEDALELLLYLSRRKNNQAINLLGSIYENGLYSCEEDIEKAIGFYSLTEDNDFANFRLGKIYSDFDSNKSISFFMKIGSNFEQYVEVCYDLAILLKDIDQEESVNRLAVCVEMQLQDSVRHVVEHLTSSISYDWKFVLPPSYTLKNLKSSSYRYLFRDQFSHTTKPEANYNLIEKMATNFNNFNPILVPQIQMARYLFLLGKFPECEKYYKKILLQEEAQMFLLFYTWLSKSDIAEYLIPYIDKHLETNIYAQYLFVKQNLNSNPRKAKDIYEKCNHLFNMKHFEIVLFINLEDDEKVMNLCKSMLDSYPSFVKEKIVSYSITRDLKDLQDFLISKLDRESIIPIDCYRLDKEGKEQELFKILSDSYSSKKLYKNCLKNLSCKSTNEIYGFLSNYQDTEDDIPLYSFYSELLWTLYINGKDSKALEYSYLLPKCSVGLERLLTNNYETVQLLVGMYQQKFSILEKKIYFQKNPNISAIFQNSKDISSFISLALEKQIIESHQRETIFNEACKLNLTDAVLAEIAFSLKLGLKAIEYYEKNLDYSNIGHTYCQNFPDLPIDYKQAIKNFRRATYYTKTSPSICNYNLGCCHMELSQYDDAILYFKKTNLTESIVMLAKCYIAKKDYQHALGYLKRIDILELDDNDMIFKLGTCYETLCTSLNEEHYKLKAIEIFTGIQNVHPEAKEHLERLQNLTFTDTLPQQDLATPSSVPSSSSSSFTLEFDDE